MKALQTSQLFTDLSAEASETVQGGCRRHSFRPYYYNYRPSFMPTYSYGYGYGGYGSYGFRGRSNSSVSQLVNVNVRYDD